MVNTLIGVSARMIIFNHFVPPLDFMEWHYLIRDQEFRVESPPPELHLDIDISLLNQYDIDWIKINCPDILPELRIKMKQYNDKAREYRITLNKLPKEDTKFMKKVHRILIKDTESPYDNYPNNK